MTWFNKLTNVFFLCTFYFLFQTLSFITSIINLASYHIYNCTITITINITKISKYMLKNLLKRKAWVSGVRLFSLTVILYIYTYTSIWKYIKGEANIFNNQVNLLEYSSEINNKNCSLSYHRLLRYWIPILKCSIIMPL